MELQLFCLCRVDQDLALSSQVFMFTRSVYIQASDIFSLYIDSRQLVGVSVRSSICIIWFLDFHSNFSICQCCNTCTVAYGQYVIILSRGLARTINQGRLRCCLVEGSVITENRMASFFDTLDGGINILRWSLLTRNP